MGYREHPWRYAILKFILILSVGFAAGFYVRDNQDEISQKTVERSKRAGEYLKQGAKASGESVKEAAKEMVGQGKKKLPISSTLQPE